MTRTEAIKNATKSRELKTKEKVQNAINILRLYGSKINGSTVAKESGVTQRSARKYLALLTK